MELFDQGVIGSFRILAEKVLVEHGFDFVFGDAGLLIEILCLAELAEYLEGGAFRGTATAAEMVSGCWTRARRRQIVSVLGFSQFGK